METRPKPFWLVLCVALGAGLAAWSLYLVGLVFLLLAAVAFVGTGGSRRKRRASLLAMLVGFELGVGTLVAWYNTNGHNPGMTPYLFALATAGAVILVAAWGILRRRTSSAP